MDGKLVQNKPKEKEIQENPKQDLTANFSPRFELFGCPNNSTL